MEEKYETQEIGKGRFAALSESDWTELEKIVSLYPVFGERYVPDMLQMTGR